MLKSEISGSTYVYAKEGQYGVMYSVQLSKKNKDDQWENGYINAQFKKDVAVDNGTKINITKGWLTFYKTKDGKTVPQIFVSEFEVEESGGTPSANNFQAEEKPDDLPF